MTTERKFIEENVKRVLLKEYLKRKTERSGFGGLDIQRTPMGTRVTLIAERPGMVIGRKGETIKELTEYVENEFKFDNPQIEVKEESNPNLNPHIMAQKLATALERGWHFRRAGHSTVRRIMSAGAKGCQVIISGKLTGQRHRTEKFREGHIKYCGETKLNWMREGYAVAKKKLGVIGIKVQIMAPEAKLPDEIELRDLAEVATIKTVDKEAEEKISEVVEGEIEGEVTGEASVEPETEVAEKEEKSKTKRKKATKDKEKAEDKKEETKEKKKPGRKPKSKKETEKEDKEEPKEEEKVEPEVEPKEELKPEATPEPEQESKPETEPEQEQEPAPESTAEPELEQAPEPEATPETDTEPEPEPEKEEQVEGEKTEEKPEEKTEDK